MRELDNVRNFLSGLGPTALLDMPFMPLFVAACFLLHPAIGWLAVGGAALVIALTLLMEFFARKRSKTLQALALERHVVVDTARRNAEVVAAMGFKRALRDRWADLNAEHTETAIQLANAGGGLGGVDQGAAAHAAERGDRTRRLSRDPLGGDARRHHRGLGPAVASARRRSRRSQHRRPPRPFPPPRRSLRVEHLTIAPPGSRKPILNGLDFELPAGSVLGIAGPSAAGKSTLARASSESGRRSPAR